MRRCHITLPLFPLFSPVLGRVDRSRHWLAMAVQHVFTVPRSTRLDREDAAAQSKKSDSANVVHTTWNGSDL